MIKKYRKKPVVVEAYQTDKEVIIHTLEGDMLASPGDYVITGLRGEQYPCKPDIFEKTYETVPSGSFLTDGKLALALAPALEPLTELAAQLVSRPAIIHDVLTKRFLAVANAVARQSKEAARTSLRGLRPGDSSLLSFVVRWVKGEKPVHGQRIGNIE